MTRKQELKVSNERELKKLAMMLKENKEQMKKDAWSRIDQALLKMNYPKAIKLRGMMR